MAKHAMSPPEAIVPGEMTVHDFYESHVDLGFRTYAVLDRERKLDGIVTIKDIGKCPREERRRKRIRDVMTKNVVFAHPDEGLYEILEKMILHGYSMVPIVSPEDRTLLGVITRRDVLTHFVPRKNRSSD